MALKHRLFARVARGWFWLRRPRTIGVRAIVTDPDGRIALIRHTYARYWYLPGGGVERGEDMTSAIHRELAEETGITEAVVERVAGIFHSRREYKDDHIVIFAMRVGSKAANALHAADTREIAEARWFDGDALPPDCSPATRRRIVEFRDSRFATGTW